ncbi:DUF1642 domain-containing protein [uncultured Enterococcus sp.]|uniref:DUF1642 domain-containing protein n=1 Tax=uncultured Enterococcus sp. TaxID=167972 RepID=UPI002AA74F49|nr:DUF1642 domain-containing protein [uncultured Enterococcus sp.]
MSKFNELKRLIDEELEISAVTRERKNKSFKLIEEIKAEQEEQNKKIVENTQKMAEESNLYRALNSECRAVCGMSITKALKEIVQYGLPSELQKKADKYDELSKPVEIPAYVAKWIEEYKKKDLNFYTSVSSMTTGDVGEWYVDNEDFYAKAWYFGYTVKQEQLYYMPVLYQKNKTLYYCFDRNGEITFGQGNLKSDKYKFTKEQIEQHFPEITDRAIEAKEEQV